MVHTQEAARAVPFLQRALVLDPSILKAHGELGKAFLQMNQWEKAVAELELASSADPGGELHYQLFRAYTKLDQRERAQGALAQSNKLRQENGARGRPGSPLVNKVMSADLRVEEPRNSAMNSQVVSCQVLHSSTSDFCISTNHSRGRVDPILMRTGSRSQISDF
jgi:tetratricopeptide (TPR) repeat protein